MDSSEASGFEIIEPKDSGGGNSGTNENVNGNKNNEKINENIPIRKIHIHPINPNVSSHRIWY